MAFELTNATISGAITSSKALLYSTLNWVMIFLVCVAAISAAIFLYVQVRKRQKGIGF